MLRVKLSDDALAWAASCGNAMSEKQLRENTENLLYLVSGTDDFPQDAYDRCLEQLNHGGIDAKATVYSADASGREEDEPLPDAEPSQKVGEWQYDAPLYSEAGVKRG